jgi:hypothetical protein
MMAVLWAALRRRWAVVLFSAAAQLGHQAAKHKV